MFFYTDTADAPWVVVKSNDKKRARLNCMKHFLSTIDYPGKDLEVVGAPDPLIVGHASQVLGQGPGHLMDAARHPVRGLAGAGGRCGAAAWHGGRLALGLAAMTRSSG